MKATNKIQTTDLILNGLHFPLPTEPYNVDGVEGRSIELQCPITVPLYEVSMVLWFKDNAGIPLYRYGIAFDQPRPSLSSSRTLTPTLYRKSEFPVKQQVL